MWLSWLLPWCVWIISKTGIRLSSNKVRVWYAIPLCRTVGAPWDAGSYDSDADGVIWGKKSYMLIFC
jgi:hypothetical protein